MGRGLESDGVCKEVPFPLAALIGSNARIAGAKRDNARHLQAFLRSVHKNGFGAGGCEQISEPAIIFRIGTCSDRHPSSTTSASGLPSDFVGNWLLLRCGYVRELAAASYPHIHRRLR